MKYVLLVLLVASCKNTSEVANRRFGGAAFCYESSTDGVVMCSFKQRNFICFTRETSYDASALCLEGIDPFDVVQGKEREPVEGRRLEHLEREPVVEPVPCKNPPEHRFPGTGEFIVTPSGTFTTTGASSP